MKIQYTGCTLNELSLASARPRNLVASWSTHASEKLRFNENLALEWLDYLVCDVCLIFTLSKTQKLQNLWIYQTRTLSRHHQDHYNCRARDTANSFDFPADFKGSRSSLQRTRQRDISPREMPLLGKKSFKPNPLPKDLRSAEEVFVIKETNEVFRSYEYPCELCTCRIVRGEFSNYRNLRAERTVSLWSAYDRFIEGCLFTF